MIGNRCCVIVKSLHVVLHLLNHRSVIRGVTAQLKKLQRAAAVAQSKERLQELEKELARKEVELRRKEAELCDAQKDANDGNEKLVSLQ